MSNNKKETERAELHKIIWRIANDLRGSVDGWDFKTYVLGMLFYRFISENLISYLNEQERRAGHAGFDYTTLDDADAEFGRVETVKEKGFYILPSELFANVRASARQDANLNETLSRIFADIEGSANGSDSEDDLKGLFDDLRQQQQAGSDGGQAQREAGQAARCDWRPAAQRWRVLGQQHRPVRRRLRIPDADVCVHAGSSARSHWWPACARC